MKGMREMKKFVLGFIVGALLMIPVTVFSQTAVENISAYLNPNVKINLDGEPLELETIPIIYEQTTYLPLRELSEKVIGMEVGWNQETSTVELKTEEDLPVTDVTQSQPNEGDEVGSNFDFSSYEEFYSVNESLSHSEISKLIDRLKSKIRIHEEVMKAAQDPKTNYYSHPEMVEPFKNELDKLNAALPQWEELLETKLQEAESKQEQ